MMQISHEVPISLLKKSKDFNDYDYCLLHLLEKPEYKKYYKEAAKEGRKVLLDNSLFELGDAMDPKTLCEATNEIKPYWYVVPDCLNDMQTTIDRFEDWKKNYQKDAYGLSIGVVQGKTWDEMKECYAYMSINADKIAIPCITATPFLTSFPNAKNNLERSMLGRQKFIRDLMAMGVWNFDKPHHLLGCTLAREFKDPIYNDYIETIDTSNPIVAGIKGLKYSVNGLEEKPSIKLCDLIDHTPTDQQMATIDYNVQVFKEICK